MQMRYRVVYGFSVLVMLACVGGSMAGALEPLHNNGGAHFSFIALFNCYLFLMVYFYLPSSNVLAAAKFRELEAETDEMMSSLGDINPDDFGLDGLEDN